MTRDEACQNLGHEIPVTFLTCWESKRTDGAVRSRQARTGGGVAREPGTGWVLCALWVSTRICEI